MEVVLIRHTSVDVPKGTCYGWSDVQVSKTFFQEASITRKNLEGLVFDRVYSSPLSRALKLAQACGYANPIIDDRVKEMCMGDWEMKAFDEIEDENLQKWYNDFTNFAPTNGEGFQDIYKRVASFLDEIKGLPLKRVAVFTHAGVLMVAGIYAGIFNQKNCTENIVPYGGIEKIII